MSRILVPSFRVHAASGNFVCKWGGKLRYLGKEEGAARTAYSAQLEAWESWRKKGAEKAAKQTPTVAAPSFSPPVPKAVSDSPSVAVLAEKLYAQIRTEAGGGAAWNCQERTEFFLSIFGARKIGSLTDSDLAEFRSAVLAKYPNPNTANARLGQTRRLLAFGKKYFPQPLNLEALKNTKRKAPPLKAEPYQNVSELINKVALLNPNLARHMLLQFWAVMRPSEVSRLVAGEGSWEPINSKCEGKVFVPNESKMKHKGQDRKILLTVEALALLEEIREYGKQGALRQALPPNMSAYQQACSKLQQYGLDFSPHFLRHSAATALSVELEAGRDTVETALGHAMPSVAGRYFPPNYATALKAMRGLSTLVPMPPAFAEKTVTRGKTNKEGKSKKVRAKARAEQLLAAA